MNPDTGSSGAPLTAVIVSRRRIDIGEVSRKGCHLAGTEPLAVGGVGLLSVDIEGQTHVELFRVTRSGPLPGFNHVYEAGLEFLPMPAGTPSLQDVAAALDQLHSR